MNIRDRIKWGTVLLLLSLMGVGNAWADRGYGHGHYHGSTNSVLSSRLPGTPGITLHPTTPVPDGSDRARTASLYRTVIATACAASQPNQLLVLLQRIEGLLSLREECPGGWRRVLPQAPN